jgi:basic membrane lipoprotein Med (substrate-binding protein (PBP1-ABC) superfamily)
MSRKSIIPLLVTVLMIAGMLAGCAGGAQETKSDKIKVFGAFATPIEEPWDGVIHDALLKAKDAGLIEYTYTEDIGYTGDMERVLREVAEQQKPDLIMGDAFVNEEAVRRVAKTTLKSPSHLVPNLDLLPPTWLSLITGSMNRHTCAV